MFAAAAYMVGRDGEYSDAVAIQEEASIAQALGRLSVDLEVFERLTPPDPETHSHYEITVEEV